MLTIDEASELAEFLEDMIERLGYLPTRATKYADISIGTYADVMCGWHRVSSKLVDPHAYDVGRWLRERFG